MHVYDNNGGWVAAVMYGGPSSGSVWVAPGASTQYLGTFYYDDHPAGCPMHSKGHVFRRSHVARPQAAPPPAALPPPAPAPAPTPPPTCSVTFDQNPISSGGGTTIRWSSSNAQLFYINSVGYVGAEVAPLSWTPDFLSFRSPQWQRSTALMRRSSAGR